MDIQDLIRALKEKADDLGISEEFPPLSKAKVEQYEKEMGVQLPELAKLVYTKVANGGIGPEESMFGLKGGMGNDNDDDAYTLYLAWMENSDEIVEDFDSEEGDVQLEWVPGLLPIAYWGCAVYNFLDCNAPGGRIVYADLTGAQMNYKKEWETGEWGLFDKPGVPLQEWLEAWLDESKDYDFVPRSKEEYELYVPPPEARAPDQLDGETAQGYRLRKAAETGDPEAQFEYGRYLHSENPRQNRDVAFAWYLKAADQGHQTAIGRVSYSYRDGAYSPIDWEKAWQYAQKSNSPLCFYLGMDDHPHKLYSKPRPDESYSPEWWRQATEFWQKRMKDSKNAAYSFGFAHESGLAPNANQEAAQEGYKRAAELGHVVAQQKLGSMTGSPEWMEKAAEAGDEKSQYDLWKYYSENDRDWKKALKYLKALASKTSKAETTNAITAKATIDLALLHYEGKQVEQDDKKAISLLERAAKFRHSQACYILGKMYLEEGHLHDPLKATEWLRKGSECGDANCFYEMGLCHEKGIGVRQDLSRACTVLKIAADKGHVAAEEKLKELQAKI